MKQQLVLIDEKKTPPPHHLTPLVRGTDTPPLDIIQMNDPVKTHDTSGWPPTENNMLDDPFSFLDSFTFKADEDITDRGRRMTPSESYSHNPSDHLFIDEPSVDDAQQFGPMNHDGTNPFAPVEHEEFGNSS